MVLIHFVSGEYGEIQINPSTTRVGQLKSQISNQYPNEMLTSLMTYEETPLNNDRKLLSEYIISETDIIKLQMQIYVYFLKEKGTLIDVDPEMSIYEIKVVIDSMFTQYNSSSLRLIHEGNNLDDNMNLKQCSIQDGTNIFVHVRDEHTTPPPKEGCIQIYIKTTSTIHTIDIQLSDTILDVKKKLLSLECNYMGLLNRMRLSYSEQYLDNDSTTLLDYNISKECLLHLIIGDEDFVNPSSGEGGGNESGGMNDWAAMEAAMAAASEMASQQAAAMNSGSPSSSRPGTASSNPASSIGGSPSTAGGGSRPFTEEDLNQITINFMDVATGDTEGIKANQHSSIMCNLFTEYSTRVNVPLNNLAFQYSDMDLPAETDITPAGLGIGDQDVVVVTVTRSTMGGGGVGGGMYNNPIPMSDSVDLTDNYTLANDKNTLFLMDTMNNDSTSFTINNMETQFSDIFSAYSNHKGVPLHTLSFYHQDVGDLPIECPTAPGMLGLPDRSTITVGGMPPRQLNNGVAGLSPSFGANQQIPLQESTVPQPETRIINRNVNMTNSSGDDVMTVKVRELKSGDDYDDDQSPFEFKINRGITLLPLVFKEYCERRGIDFSSLQFVSGPRRLTHNANETALDIGVSDGSTIFALKRGVGLELFSGAPKRGEKFNINIVSVASPSKTEFFRTDPYTPLSRTLNAYAQRISVQRDKLRFFRGDVMLNPSSKDTAYDLGIGDGATIFALKRGKRPMAADVPTIPTLTANALETMYDTDPSDMDNMIFEPIVQIMDVANTNEGPIVKLFDGAHFLKCKLGGSESLNKEAMNRMNYAIIQVNRFQVGTSTSSLTNTDRKTFDILDFDEYAPNPGRMVSDISSTEDLHRRCDVLVAKKILARSIVYNFVCQCHEHGKVRAEKARKVIVDLVWRGIASQRRQTLRSSSVIVQKVHRGYLARKIHAESVQNRLEEYRRFTSIWKPAISIVPESDQTLSGWSLVREKIDMKTVEKDFDEETDEKLNRAAMAALQEPDEFDESSDEEEGGDETDQTLTAAVNKNELPQVAVDWSKFQISAHVLKFIKKDRDMLYRNLFIMRMKQLAKGETSHKLKKPLKGCQSVIYESYMDNSKGGFRLLWTQEGDRIVVWFIAKHKEVSRLAKLIDDAKNRTARQDLPEDFITDELDDKQTIGIKGVMLDAMGNVPLKLYDVSFNEIDAISDKAWKPPMHLTKKETEVVQAKGTVLLLGRSGTGKTICISNRIEYDRLRFGEQPDFSQLFVSRSSRLCKYVVDIVGDNDTSKFTTFDRLVPQLEKSLGTSLGFTKSQHVNFARFNKDFYSNLGTQKRIGALVVWKSIRTFLKGSKEAYRTETSVDKETGEVLSEEGVLSKAEWVSGDLGKNRCKLSLDMRHPIYEVFMKYKAWLKGEHLWDDCDRIRALLKKIEYVGQHDPSLYHEIKGARIYVDEVQDYLQIEILLFFYIAKGMGALFLAGDPAQSVVEGTDFRFEEIRSIGDYYFKKYGGKNDAVPAKPRTVNVNFRSHSGILKCAGGFLDLLFKYFKNSVKELPKDRGLFKGARPGTFYEVDVQQLSSLLKSSLQGAVVLTHDESAPKWKEKLGYELVYGIREAKGLEFKTVIILDFFAEIEERLQKPWRNLLKGNRQGEDFEVQYPIVETHLKLVYTAVTRCIEQLFFAETTSSFAGEAALKRYLTTPREKGEVLATVNKVDDLKSMEMTNDQFCVLGIDNAELASSSEIEYEEALAFLKRSEYCFDKASNSELLTKTKTQLESMNLRCELLTGHWDRRAVSSGDQDLEGDIGGEMEEKAAEVIEKLLKENLLLECTNLLNTVVPVLPQYTQDKLEEAIVSKMRQSWSV